MYVRHTESETSLRLVSWRWSCDLYTVTKVLYDSKAFTFSYYTASLEYNLAGGSRGGLIDNIQKRGNILGMRKSNLLKKWKLN